MSQQILNKGMRTFTIIWLGELVSQVGSGLTMFTLGVWVYLTTGSAVQFTLTFVFFSLPALLLLPLAGALADRWERRLTMICSNAAAGLCTLVTALLLYWNQLQVWHIYIIVTVIAVFSNLLTIVSTATTALLVPKQHYGRVSGMVQVAQAASQIVPPLLGGILVLAINMYGVILIDFFSYLFAIVTLAAVRVPNPDRQSEESTEQRSILREALRGWEFIKERQGLLALLLYFSIINLTAGIARILFAPMILSFTTADVLGTILAVAGGGFMAGGILMSAWGGPKDRVFGILTFGFLFGISLFLVGVRSDVMLIAIAGFCMHFFIPLLNGCSQAIWMSKTPPHVQGRVFAVRRMLGLSTIPLAYLIAGPLADHVFGPLVESGRFWARVVGEGPGRAIGLIFIVTGFLTALVQVAGYLYPRLRRVEEELPDAATQGALSSS